MTVKTIEKTLKLKLIPLTREDREQLMLLLRDCLHHKGF